MGSDAQAEDIAQEVFVRAYAHFDQLRTSATSGGWLKTVATNLALNHLQRYRRRWRWFSEIRPERDDEDSGELEGASVVAGLGSTRVLRQAWAFMAAAAYRTLYLDV